MEELFMCYVWHDTSEGWKERERKLLETIGKLYSTAASGGGRRELKWYVSSITSAVQMRDAALGIPGFHAEAREI